MRHIGAVAAIVAAGIWVPSTAAAVASAELYRTEAYTYGRFEARIGDGQRFVRDRREPGAPLQAPDYQLMRRLGVDPEDQRPEESPIDTHGRGPRFKPATALRGARRRDPVKVLIM